MKPRLNLLTSKSGRRFTVRPVSTYTIGQVAERSGFPTSTLRFYGQHGLLEPVGRTEAGYRIYDDGSLARLRFIGRAKQLGCTLEEIADLARLWEAEDCGPVQTRLHELVTATIADAQRRSSELIAFITQLQTTAAHLGGEPVDGPCHTDCACLRDQPNTGGFVPATLGERADPAIVCTLSAGDVPDRIQNWQGVLGHVAHRDRTPDGGVRLVLDEAAPLDEVTRLAAAEQACCAFFEFAVTIDGRGVALEVRAPDEAHEILEAVFGAA